MKRILALVVAMVLGLCAAACAEAINVPDLNVWSVVPKGDGVYWNSMQHGVDDFCKEMGIAEYTLTACVDTANVQQQIELCEAAISAGADILLVRLSDPEAFLDVVTRASEEGTLVYSLQNAPSGGLEAMVPGWTGISPSMLGQAQAQAVVVGVEAGNVAKDATVLYLSPTLTNPTHITNREAFVETLSAAYPEMTIITDETGSGNAATVAAELVDAYFLSVPDLTVMVANGAPETGVMAAKAEGLDRMEELWVIGCDGGEEQAEMLYIGSLDVSVIQDTYSVGYLAAANALKALQGEQVEFYTPVGCTLLVPEGVEAYCEAGGWDMTAWNSYEG